ncbi:MAG: 16S rRNA (adenine(1518)-N(6)/adenine(1519)-N(6))-dimethyltransferase RsmA [Gammaproteobacteria bacterium]|nr:16S rRNA (adenine(1518)-N(6)/adenine(1519)-N(6))-dimethyltransferase RsmA [Gammaproteobacteria bacterium]
MSYSNHSSPHQARKRFGQNFLVDQNVIDRIVRAIRPNDYEQHIEVGPGLGALTLPLLEQTKKLTVIELDRDIIPKLTALCQTNQPQAELTVISQDVLTVDFSTLAGSERIRVIGNLPYNISSPLLFHLMRHLSVIKDMHFMLQKEVVDRIVAAPDTEHYGRLSVMLQFYCHAEKLFTVGSHAFNPPPKVESAIIRLVPHTDAPITVSDMAIFSEVVKAAFAQRRKMLRNTLKILLDEASIEKAGVDPQARAETLSLSAFAALSECVHSRRLQGIE